MCLSNTLCTLNIHNITYQVYSIEIFNSKNLLKLKKERWRNLMHILGMPHLGFSPVKWSQKVPGINAGFVGPEVYII